jgi:hypothetical protein
MRQPICLFAPVAIVAIAALPAVAQQPPAPAATGQMPSVKTTVDEVVLDFIVRDNGP